MTETNKPKPVLKDSTYESTKTIVQSVLPVFALLCFVFGVIFDIPGFVWLLGGIVILEVFLGMALRASSRNYYASPYSYDGEMVIISDGGGVRTFSLEVHGDPENLAYKSVITFKVQNTMAPEPPE